MAALKKDEVRKWERKRLEVRGSLKLEVTRKKKIYCKTGKKGGLRKMKNLLEMVKD